MNGAELDRRAAESLGTARFQIDRLAEAVHPGENEAIALRAGNAQRWDEARFDRMIEVCSAAHMATENAVKAFTAGVVRQLPNNDHRIEVLLAALPIPVVEQFKMLILPLEPEDLNPWRTAATYVYEEQSLSILAQITPNYAAEIYSAALASCQHAVSEVLAGPSSEPRLAKAATRLQESVEQAREARYVHLLRSEPPFARSTYTARDMEAHAEALQQPLMPALHPRRQIARESHSRLWGMLTRRRARE